MSKTIKLKVQLLEHVDLGPESDGEEIIIDDPSGDNTGQTGESGNQPGENEQGSSEIRVETEIRNEKTTQTIFGNDTTSLIFKINIPFENFESLKIRDVEFVRDKDYVAKSGSTIIDFTETGLNKLKKFVNGDYVVSFKFRDRTVTTNLTISLTETKNPFENFVEKTKTNTEGGKTEVKNDAKQSTDKSEEGALASINAPNSGTFNYYDSLTTGISVFSIGFILLLAFLLVSKRLKKKKSSYINYKKKSTTALKSLTFLFMFISLGFAVTLFKETTLGIGFMEVPLHVNDTSLTADILGTDRIAWTKATVVVLQKSLSGYRIYLHGSDTSLKNFFDENLAINSIEEAGPLVNNSFGYTLENPEGREDLVTWYPINLEENRSLLADIDGPVEAGAEISIYFGVRSKNLDVGAYSLDLTYSAISKEPLKMQEMSSDVCSNLEPGATYEFEDERDGKVYTVARLADDECWMTSDLETELIVRDNEAGIKKINADESEEIVPITNENTDLNTKSAFIPNKSTMTDEDISWPDSCDSEEACQINQSFKHTNEDNETTFYYSWFTATLNSLSTQEEIMSGETRAKDSICPKGWSLPTSNNYTSLISNYGYDENVYYSAPISISGKGKVNPYNAGEIQGENNKDAYYYTSDLSLSEGQPEMYYFEIYTSKGDVDVTDSDTFYGTPLRCIANLSSANIIYNKNTTSNRIGNFPENSRATANENKKIEYTLPENIPTRSGYRFGGWALSEDGMPEYEPGEEIKIKNRSIVLYAVWLKETGKTMQEMTSNYCRNEIKANELYLFTDSRDEKEYIVSKYPDGNCWMAENLDLDLSSDITLTPEDTDIEENYTPSIATPTEEGEWTYDEECLEGNIPNCSQYFFDTGKKSDGNFYNILSATAGTISINEEQNGLASPKSSICPKGWKLPDTEQYINLLGNQGFEYGDEDDITPDMKFPKPYDTSKGFYIGTEYVRESSSGLNYGFYENGVVDMQEASMRMNAYQTAPDAVIIAAQYYGNMGYYMSAKASDMVGGFGLLLEGLPVRCYSAFDTLEIVYDKNTDDVVSNFPEENTQKSLSEGRDVEISNQAPTRDGYIFAGWATSADGSAEYSPGGTLTASSPEITLYAIWYNRVPGVETMQSLTPEICNTLNPEETYGLKDIRDGKFYTISLLSDGRCWMTDDLKLILTAGETLTSETTDLNDKSEWQVPNTTTEGDSADWSYDEANSHYWPKTNTVYYNPRSATADSMGSESQGISANSICPKGWYLPTKSNYESLRNKYSDRELISDPVNLRFNGQFDDSKENEPYGDGRNLGYLTGTYYYGSLYYLYGNKDSDGELDNFNFNTTSNYYGRNIRCILNSPVSYTLTFDKNSGDDPVDNMPSSLTEIGHHGSATFTLPESVPTRDGYTFHGWGTYSGAYYGDTLIQPGDSISAENSTLYAIWTKNTTIVFDKNTDDSVENFPKPIIITEYGTEVTIPLPEAPTREGYKFLYWTTYSYGGTSYEAGSTYTFTPWGDEITLYAQWQAPQPLAILDSTGNLDFVYDLNAYSVGNTYENSLGTSGEITKICNVEAMSSYSNDCHGNLGSSNTEITSASFRSSFSGYKPTSTAYWFYYDTALTNIYNLENLNTQNATSMWGMFSAASSLTSLTLPEGFDQNATNMSAMFQNASSLTSLTLPTGFGQNATNMGHMFSGASSLTSLTLPAGFGINTTNMSWMFNYASALTSLTLPAGFGQNATNMGYMFYNATSLEHIYVNAGTDWNTKEVAVTDSSDMFYGASKLPSFSWSNAGDATNAHIGNKDGVWGYFEDVATKPTEEQTNPLGVVKSSENSDPSDSFTLLILSIITTSLGITLIIVIMKRKKEENAEN